MSQNSFFSKSNSIKITHSILFIVTAMYILESIFIRGLFTNVYLALIEGTGYFLLLKFRGEKKWEERKQKKLLKLKI